MFEGSAVEGIDLDGSGLDPRGLEEAIGIKFSPPGLSKSSTMETVIIGVEFPWLVESASGVPGSLSLLGLAPLES